MNKDTETANLAIALAHPEQARAAILAALSAWVNQRPGLEYENYGDAANYRQEMRRITNQRADAFELLAAVGWRSSIDAPALLEAFGAFSRRLSVTLKADGDHVSAALDYCTGQYWPTEYRAAACAVLSSALWAYWRDQCPADAQPHAGSWIRCTAARELGAPLARRWFDYDARAAADMRAFRKARVA